MTLLLCGTLLLAGCAELGYYAQSVGGHLSLIAAREPVDSIIDDPATPAELRERLVLARAAREFASDELALPRDDSYSSYVQLERPYVVWSVVAAPPLSLAPRTWCFPVAGCVAYRGYFDERDAVDFATGLRAAGDDVYVGGVSAYSTLGWFDDPLLSSMLGGAEHDLVAVIFHELAHRRLYLAGDSNFNEAFAVAVEREGLRRWLAAEGTPAARRDYEVALQRRAAVIELALAWRRRLAALYASPLAEDVKHRRKQELLDGLRGAYRARAAENPALAGAENFFGEGLNNARLASVATYHALVPDFERLLAAHEHELPAFYAACERLAALDAHARAKRLRDPAAMPLASANEPGQ